MSELLLGRRSTATREASGTRARTHPGIRFASDEAKFDSSFAAHALAAEPETGHQALRQTAFFRHGPVTLNDHLFEPGASLTNYIFDGPITMNVLEAEIDIAAAPESRLLETSRLKGPGLPPGMTRVARHGGGAGSLTHRLGWISQPLRASE